MTRRGAASFVAMALGGALAIPRPGPAALPKVLSIAVPDLVASFNDSGNIAHLTATLITDDLRGTGQFAPLDSLPWPPPVRQAWHHRDCRDLKHGVLLALMRWSRDA
jgi:hypothetical protein